MLDSSLSPTEKRKVFRAGLASNELMRFPGALNPLSTRLIQEIGFEGVYISGGALAADLGLPDIGLTTLSEVAGRGQQIARVTDLPCLIDADTGFGEPMNVARTIQSLEAFGLAGCHIEDQINPKRCGHLDGKDVVSTEEMLKRIGAAVSARNDPNFVICARTDARAIEGLDATVDRAKAYLDAGADLIFPEALENESEFESFRKAVDAPILANMTEFGKSRLLDANTLASLGVNVVIWPVTLLRIAMGAVERALGVIDKQGSQVSLIDSMQTRARLYELLDYASFESFDQDIFNFKISDKGDRS